MGLRARNLFVSYGPCAVLEGLSFDIAAGSFVCVLGINGAGKSSLLRAVAGLLTVTGELSLDEVAITRMEPRVRARSIAFLPQSGEVHWPIPVRDAVMLGRMPHLSSLARPSAADFAAVEAALAATDALALAERPLTDLSGGERARALLARALAVEAPLLLADEPIAALDPRHQLDVMGLFAALAGRGRTVIAAVHDLALASRFATRAVVIAGRGIVADGPPHEVLKPDLIARVFGIEAVTAQRNGETAIVPWLPAKR